MNRPNALQKFLHRFLMLKPVSLVLARILPPADEFARWLTRGNHTVAEWVGLPIIELDTLGARSGQRRSHPLVGLFDGDKIALIGSNFGQKRHPAWIYNLRSHPDCIVHVAGRAKNFRARETDGEERAKYWELALSYYKGYAAYEKRCAPRRIAVIVLEPK
jgi:deazaflavin-dependent oxidoreductase (nitroreductase family)